MVGQDLDSAKSCVKKLTKPEGGMNVSARAEALSLPGLACTMLNYPPAWEEANFYFEILKVTKNICRRWRDYPKDANANRKTTATHTYTHTHTHSEDEEGRRKDVEMERYDLLIETGTAWFMFAKNKTYGMSTCWIALKHVKTTSWWPAFRSNRV